MNTNALIKSHLKKQIALQKKLIKEAEKHALTLKKPAEYKYVERLKKGLKEFESQMEARTEIPWNY